MGCASCHSAESGSRGPALDGLMGSTVLLERNETVTADEEYIRESIDVPNTAYQDRITEDEVKQMILYIRSLK